MRFLSLSGWCAAVFACLMLAVLAPSPARSAPIDDLKRMEARLNELLDAARYPEAEEVALAMIDVARRNANSLNPNIQAAVQSNLSGVYATWGQYQSAEQVSLQTIQMLEQQFGKDYFLLEQPLTNLGIAYFQQERYAEAAQAQRRALQLRQRQHGASSVEAAVAMENLAVTYDNWGYRTEAEPLYRRALGIKLQAHGAGHPSVARTAINLAHMYRRENRLADAEQFYQYVLGLPADGVYPKDLINAYRELGMIYAWTNRIPEAEASYRRSIELKKQIYGESHPLARLDSGLANLYLEQGRLDEAEVNIRQELAASEEFYGKESSDYALRLLLLAQTLDDSGRTNEALALMDQALGILGNVSARPSVVCDAHRVRGKIGWKLGRHEAAVADFGEAMKVADQIRVFSLGGEHERAQAFSDTRTIYTDVFELYLAAGKIGAAFEVSERGRGRSLVDQLAAAHVDLLEGVPPQEAQRLREAENQAKRDVASYERQLEILPAREDLNEAAIRQETIRLRGELALARQRAVDAYAAIRTASPKFRQIVGREFKPIELAALQTWLEDRQAMMLYYAMTDAGAWLIAIGGDAAPRATKIEIGQEQAIELGVKPGRLDSDGLEQILASDQGTGVLQWLSTPASGDQGAGKLHALWQTLVPEAERARLLDGKVDRLVVIPDGALALIPFEALATRLEPEVSYLVDAGPAVDYGPSASIFSLLAERPGAVVPSGREPVLTLGDPAYGTADAEGQSQRARYSRLGGQLGRLPYSGREATWVADVFGKQGVKAAILKDKLATERMVRGNVAGRRIVHLACHGLCDQSYGNFFGALALAPGGGAQVNSADDGMLTLSEIYELDLAACELAILSACQTNYGEQQQGEGVWALTRGFLVAGSRRVVASNWLVDDEAAASIISYYCSLLAKAESEGRTPDYAQTLQEAKRWGRSQEKWRHPFYWATFVLVGPN